MGNTIKLERDLETKQLSFADLSKSTQAQTTRAFEASSAFASAKASPIKRLKQDPRVFSPPTPEPLTPPEQRDTSGKQDVYFPRSFPSLFIQFQLVRNLFEGTSLRLRPRRSRSRSRHGSCAEKEKNSC